MRTLTFALMLALAGLAEAQDRPARPTWVCVTTSDALTKAVAPLKALRVSQGMDVVVMQNASPASDLQSWLLGRVAQTRPDYLLLCLLYTSPSPRDATLSRMPSSA